MSLMWIGSRSCGVSLAPPTRRSVSLCTMMGRMTTVTVHLKGLTEADIKTIFGSRDELNRAIQRDDHPLHSQAWAEYTEPFRAYEPGHTTRETVSYETDLTDPLAVCEDAFRRFNIGDASDPVVAEYRGAGNRSLSVGDVVVVDGVAYGCDSAGWSVVEFGPVKDRFVEDGHGLVIERAET